MYGPGSTALVGAFIASMGEQAVEQTTQSAAALADSGIIKLAAVSVTCSNPCLVTPPSISVCSL